jgi:serine/threonine-protein kinase
MIGKKIDPYEIEEILGRGGMGVVYRARDTKLERDVAIKMMDIQYASDPNFLKRFQSEAKALARLQDPNIVSIFSLLETTDGICIVMEYVRGTTLAKLLIPQAPLPIPRVIKIFKQLLLALSHAHKEGVIHRDIKPANIIVGDDDRIKVADFGLAKIKQEFAATATKGTAGTLYYMSPEQFRGLKEVDNRGDIYSAGMSLYECLTGKLPFGIDDSYYTIAQQVVHGQVPPPETMKLEIPGGLVAIVKRMIACDVNDRYQSADDALKDLEAFEQSGWVGAGSGALKGFRGKAIWVAAAGVVVVAVALSYIMFRPAAVPSTAARPDSSHVRSDPAVTNSRGANAQTSLQTDPGTGSPASAKSAGSLSGNAPRAGAGKSAQAARSGKEAGQGEKSPPAGGAVETPADDGADPPVNLPVDVEPKVISRAEPDYPEAQKKSGVTGDVRLLVLVDREGRVQKVRVQSYDAEAFINPAIEAARQCVFSPAVANRVKVRAWAPLRIRFGARQDGG